MLTDNEEDLDVAVLMYSLIEYSENYRKTTGSLWNYYRDELTDDTNDINFPNKNVINSESFKLIILLMMQTNLVKKKLKLLFH